jgi:hypothetical protein
MLRWASAIALVATPALLGGCGVLALLAQGWEIEGVLDAGQDTRDAGDGDGDGGVDGGVPSDAGCVLPSTARTPALPEPCTAAPCTLFKVGFTPTGCPASEGGACDFDASSTTSPIQDALAATSDGDVVWLYPGAFGETYAQSSWRIDNSITMEGAPGHGPEEIVLAHEGDLPVGIVHLLGDGITLRNFTIRTAALGHAAISANKTFGFLMYTDGFSVGHTIERLVLDAQPGWGLRNINSVIFAIELGSSSSVRNCDIRGWWASALHLSGKFATTIDDVEFVHNTVVLTEGTPAVNVGHATNVVIRNNILSALQSGSPAVVRTNPLFDAGPGQSDAVVEGNVVSGYPEVVAADVTAGLDNQLVTDPGFARWDRADVVASSPAVCGGVDVDAGPTDLRGFDRAPTVGALSNVATTSLTSPVRVGASSDDCDGPCDFFGEQSLQAALWAAPPQGVVQLYGDELSPMRFRAEPLVIDRPLTLEGAPDQQPGAVEIFHDQPIPIGAGMVTVAVADGVTLRNLKLRCAADCQRAVVFDPGWRDDVDDPWDARDGLVDRVIAVAPTSGLNVEEAFFLAAGGVLRNSVAAGHFEALARVNDEGVTIVGNTLYSQDRSATGPTGLYIAGAREMLGANNLFAFDPDALSSITSPLRLSKDGTGPTPSGSSMRTNQFYDVDLLVTDSLAVGLPSTQGSNCVSGPADAGPGDRCPDAGPGLVAPTSTDFHIRSNSGARDRGDSAHVSSGLDLYGRPRINGSSVDVGAVEWTDGDP